jgi:two-component system sensor histidine kinase RegB
MTVNSLPKTLPNQHYLNASWLLKLRWVAVIGQVATILGSIAFFQTQIPMSWAMVVVITLTALSNLFLTFWFRRWRKIDERMQNNAENQSSVLPWNLILGLILVMDMLSLTTLLFTTGGPNNPFYLFFFVNLSLCALMLNRRWAWAINLLTIVCFAGLMFEHYDIEHLDLGLGTIRSRQDVSLAHVGILAAFATCSSVIVYFMTRLTDELREQQQHVRQAQTVRANSDKIEALGTLAAGTAHELATPLSTIAIVARDVEQAFEENPPDFPGAKDVIEDVHLIRSQLDRCRAILDRMASHAGEAIGEPIQPATVADLSNLLLEGLRGRGRVQLTLDEAAHTETLNIPLMGLSQAMRGLVQNALDADRSDRSIRVSVERLEQDWEWKIRDQGPGMSAAELSRVSEPFYTTKPPGEGMGLGVFLAKNVIRRLGGAVEFESASGEGTCVTVCLPAK